MSSAPRPLLISRHIVSTAPPSAMLFGMRYQIVNTGVEFEADRPIAGSHSGKHRWRYGLEEVDGATRVVETCDFSISPVHGPLVRTP